MSRSRALAVACALLPAVAATAQDWKGMGRLEGKVSDHEGKPLADVTVKLELPARGGGTTATTDKKGRWAVGGIAAGKWDLDFEAAGHTPRKISVTLPSEGTRLPPIEVKLEKAVAIGPPPEVLGALSKAEAAYKDGRFAEAVAEYEKLLALRPDLSTTIHQQIGFSCIQLKSYEKALEHLQKVLDADPANTQIRGIMAQAALEGGMLERGMALLKAIDESAIKSPDLFFNLGVNLLNANRPEEAIAYFTKAVALDPTYVDGYFRRALAHLQLQRMGECRADLQRVLELTPEGPQADAARKTLEQLK
jgi:tetratricopeptide (TPR) repeat protein